MSAAITAIAISTAATLYMAEEQRKAQSDADERLKQDKIAAGVEQAWQQKKKGIADQNAANAALRLRGSTADGSPVGFIPGSTGGPAPIPGTLGILGGVGGGSNQVNLPPGAQQALVKQQGGMKMSSPLGL